MIPTAVKEYAQTSVVVVVRGMASSCRPVDACQQIAETPRRRERTDKVNVYV